MKRKNDANREFGKRIQTFRMAKGLSATQVAAHLGVAISTYREWENGRAVSGLPYVKLAEILNKGVSEILGVSDGQTKEILSHLTVIERSVRAIKTCL